jgi:hypothetical protein
VRSLAAGALVAGTLLLSAPAAAAAPAASTVHKTAAPCTVRVADRPFRNGRTISLPANRKAPIAVTALDEKPRFRVQAELAGVSWTIGSGRGSDFGWRRTLDVPRSATFGVGIYRLRVRTIVHGRACLVSGYFKITRRAPVTTVTGAAAALAVLLGGIGLVAVLARRGGRRLRTRQGFGVDDPLGGFIAVNTPGDYVGWAEVACDIGARTFVTTKPSADDVRAFMASAATKQQLAEMKARGIRLRLDDSDTVMPRLRWRPRLVLVAPLLAVLTGLGVLMYLQQSGAVYPTPKAVIVAAAAGLVAGTLIGNLARLLGTGALNRRLRRAEEGLDVELHEPRYPPIDHLDELDTFVWTPTHTIPDGPAGQAAWDEADRSKQSVATLDPGLPVRVVEQRDGLAQVVCSNGWVGWTDAEPLVAIDT